MTDDKAKPKGDWVAIRFEWLVVVHDEIHEWLPNAVANLIAARYFSATTKETFVSADTLAKCLNADRRNVQRALKKLIAAGLLACRTVGGKNKHSIPLSLIRVLRNALQERSRLHQGAFQNVSETRSTARPNPFRSRSGSQREADADSLSEPPIDGLDGRGKRPPKPRSQKRSVSTSFPDDWVLSNDELTTANRIASWDLPHTEAQFEAFRDWYLSQGKTSCDWQASWRKWCRSGRDYEAAHPLPEDQPLTGMAGAEEAVMNYYKRTKH